MMAHKVKTYYFVSLRTEELIYKTRSHDMMEAVREFQYRYPAHDEFVVDWV